MTGLCSGADLDELGKKVATWAHEHPAGSWASAVIALSPELAGDGEARLWFAARVREERWHQAVARLAQAYPEYEHGGHVGRGFVSQRADRTSGLLTADTENEMHALLDADQGPVPGRPAAAGGH